MPIFHHNLNNPFSDKRITPPNETDPVENVKLARALLGDRDADEYAKALEGEPRREAKQFGMTDEERAMAEQGERELKEWQKTQEGKMTPEKRKREWLTWTEEIGKDEEWLEETFTFHSDCTLTAEGNVDLSHLTTLTTLTRFPEGLTSITGDLNLGSLTSADKEKLRKLYPQHATKIV